MTTINQVLVEGTLFIRSIYGQYGRFNVGKLVSPLGEFSIKDKLIDQYEEGAYEGTFELGKIFQAERRVAGGGYIIELRARLDDITLFDEASLPDDAPVGVAEVDPIEEEQSQAEPAQEENPKSLLKRKVSGKSAKSIEADDDKDEKSPSPGRAELFGPLWPLGETVKLDATVDRAVFRQQRDELKKLNYVFDPKDQIWRLSAE